MTNNTALATQPKTSISNFLNSEGVMKSLQNSISDEAKRESFKTSLIELVSNDKNLAQCDQKALLLEAMRAATLNLPLSKALGYSYIVAYNNSVRQPDGTWKKIPTPTFILSYKGMIQLSLRSGQYKSINCGKVYEGELQNFDKIEGTFDLNGEKKSDKIIGYFAAIRYVNDARAMCYMSVEDVAKHAKKFSKGLGKDVSVKQLVELANKEDDLSAKAATGWLGNFNAMAEKTVMRKLLSRFGYMSIEMAQAMSGEDKVLDAAEQRNSVINESANTQTVNFEEATYEEVNGEMVDTDTGEIKQPASDGNEPKMDF